MELTPEQRDRCFIFVNVSETGRVTLDEIMESISKLKGVNYTPEISEEFMELILSQTPAPVDEEEILQIGWGLIGTVIDASGSFFSLGSPS